MEDIIVSTTFEVPGHRVVKWLDMVFGITVRTRGVGGKIKAGLRGIVGGEVGAYVELANEIRHEAMTRMMQEAKDKGANGILGVRFDSSEIGEGNTEVFCYGTAVILEKA